MDAIVTRATAPGATRAELLLATAVPNTFMAAGHDAGDPADPGDWRNGAPASKYWSADVPYQAIFDGRPMYDNGGTGQLATNWSVTARLNGVVALSMLRDSHCVAYQIGTDCPHTPLVRVLLATCVCDCNAPCCRFMGPIHPRVKQTVGRRLATAARALVYGDASLLHTGPVISGCSVTPERHGPSLDITFDQVVHNGWLASL